jgi:hypothetical protein
MNAVPVRLQRRDPGDEDARAQEIGTVCIATAERYPAGIRTVEVYIGGTWPGRGWDGWTVEETALATAECWRTWGEA